MRTVKRYSNRKLYDTSESRYITLEQIGTLVRQGEDVKVLDNITNADLTGATLAQIIFEEEKRHPRLSVQALQQIIRVGLPAA